MKHKLRVNTRVALAVIACSVFSSVAGAANCKPVSGTVSALVPLVPCSTDFLGCFQGQLDGDLTGSFSSGLTALQPLPPNGIGFTATTTVQLANGTITTLDRGAGFDCAPGTLAC